ncbi:unnamed protein product [Tuber melanosporum]|uniref:(Perigord truffle) hypothetical protein n=1 Tax=Tuber melanosporum (strain Mel28) TaxID=656061 RepID=D5GGI2_TUBMM|nr:uncharacterized protein GSTUM_00007399001 [Tuber melanosporum]CAZ83625.1 unnamed protein product [Tuber melanosporum]
MRNNRKSEQPCHNIIQRWNKIIKCSGKSHATPTQNTPVSNEKKGTGLERKQKVKKAINRISMSS